MCLDVSYALFPSFLLAQSPLPSPGTSPVRVYLRVSFPQGFHLPSLQGFLESSTDTGPLTKGCSTHSFHAPYLSVCVYLKAGAEVKPPNVLPSSSLEHHLSCSRLSSASFSPLLPTGLPIPLQDQFNLMLDTHQLGKAYPPLASQATHRAKCNWHK